MWVIVVGNPFDGMSIIGPFDSGEDAINHGEGIGDNWWVLKVEQPEERSK